MKARVKTSITIHAPASDVFKYLADTQYHALWNPHLQRVSPQMKLSKGAEYRTVNILLGVRISTLNVVSVFTADREIELRNQTGMLDYRANYRLESKSATETRVICTTAVSATGKAFYFAKPMMELLAQRELKADLAALKTAVEQRVT